MSERTIQAFQVPAPLFNQLVGVLQELPAKQVRHLLNRIESGEVTVVYAAGDLGGHKRTGEPAGGKKKRPSKRRVANQQGGK